MRQVALIVGFLALACLLFMGAYPSTSGALSSALDYETADQSLVMKIKKEKAKNCKKARCEPGMFVLDKPNIYGACCQAGAEPLKHKTAPAEKEKCKFPGEVGEPPNCKCPDDTEFMGYKGCVKKVEQKVCCTGVYPNGVSTGKSCGAPEAAIRKIISSARLIAAPNIAPDSITCAPAK